MPGRDLPMLLDLWRAGRMPPERLNTSRIKLEDVQTAFDDLRSGRDIRSVIINRAHE